MPGSPAANSKSQVSVLGRGMAVLRSSRLILDAGCGAGRAAIKLAAGARVIAMDRDAEAQARAPRHPNIWYVRADVDRSPIATDALDAVYSFGLLQVLGVDGNEDIRRALREFQRMLRSTGVAVMGTLADFRTHDSPFRSLTGAEVSQCMRNTFSIRELIGLMDSDGAGNRSRYWYIHAVPVTDPTPPRRRAMSPPARAAAKRRQ